MEFQNQPVQDIYSHSAFRRGAAVVLLTGGLTLIGNTTSQAFADSGEDIPPVTETTAEPEQQSSADNEDVDVSEEPQAGNLAPGNNQEQDQQSDQSSQPVVPPESQRPDITQSVLDAADMQPVEEQHNSTPNDPGNNNQPQPTEPEETYSRPADIIESPLPVPDTTSDPYSPDPDELPTDEPEPEPIPAQPTIPVSEAPAPPLGEQPQHPGVSPTAPGVLEPAPQVDPSPEIPDASSSGEPASDPEPRPQPSRPAVTVAIETVFAPTAQLPTPTTPNAEQPQSPEAPAPPSPPSGPQDADPSFTFPLLTTQEVLNQAPPSVNWCEASPDPCHHDYPAADLGVPEGTIVVSPVEGVVVSAYDNNDAPYGSTVVIDRDGTHEKIYMAHMGDGTIQVAAGQRVSQGQHIGAVGGSDDAMGTPPHLHIDKLNASYSTRVGCSGAGCAQHGFLDTIQTELVAGYQLLPGSDVPPPPPTPPTPPPAPSVQTPSRPTTTAVVPGLLNAVTVRAGITPTALTDMLGVPPAPPAVEPPAPPQPEGGPVVSLNAEQEAIIRSLGLEPAKEDYLRMAVSSVLTIRAQGESINPEAVIGQSVLESGYGQSGLTQECNNFFGMKANDSTPPEDRCRPMSTGEYDANGSPYTIPDEVFLQFDTGVEGFLGYVAFVEDREWFADALAFPDDTHGYLSALMNGDLTWATSRSYVQDVENVIDYLRLREIVAAA